MTPRDPEEIKGSPTVCCRALSSELSDGAEYPKRYTPLTLCGFVDRSDNDTTFHRTATYTVKW